MFVGGLDVRDFLAFVAPHEEHAGAYSVLLELPHRVADLRDGHAAFHRVQQALRTALGPDPHPVAAQFGKLRGHARVQTIRTRDALKWDVQSAAPHLRGELVQPAVVDGEHIVGEPQLLGMVAIEDPLDLIHYRERGPAPVRLPKCGMAAPAAMIGAAARRNDGYRSGAVVFAPDAQVLVDIDAFAVRPGLRVEVRQQSRRAGVDRAAVAGAKVQARHLFQRDRA